MGSIAAKGMLNGDVYCTCCNKFALNVYYLVNNRRIWYFPQPPTCSSMSSKSLMPSSFFSLSAMLVGGSVASAAAASVRCPQSDEWTAAADADGRSASGSTQVNQSITKLVRSRFFGFYDNTGQSSYVRIKIALPLHFLSESSQVVKRTCYDLWLPPMQLLLLRSTRALCV